MNENIKIDLGNFCIRRYQQEDAPSLTKYANNRNIWINLRDGFPHPYRKSDAEFFIKKFQQLEPLTVYAIATPTEVIGSIGFSIGEDVHRFAAELGYWLAEPFWGKGIMTKVVKAVCEFGFHEFGLRRIFAEPYISNLASAKVLEKAGFQKEGILRQNVFKDGQFIDQFLYSLISND